MSKQIDDGGPAFPGSHNVKYEHSVQDAGDKVVVALDGAEVRCTDSGLSIRDWFAGQAMAGLLANSSLEWPEGKDAVVIAAKQAYWAADAMIEARKEAK